MVQFIRLFLLLMTATLASESAIAQSWRHQLLPGQAREQVQNGENIPLNQILQSLKQEFGGYHTDVNLFSASAESPDAVYEIDWITEDGRKLILTINARTGAIMNTERG